MSERRPRRPPIRAVLILMLLIAVMTPMVGLFFFRVFENQLIRKTEAELIAQSAAIAAAYGVKSWRVEAPEDLAKVLAEAVAHDGPTLVDVVTQPLEQAAAPVRRWMG